MKIHFLYFFIQLFNYFFIHFLSSSHKHLNRYMPSIPYKNRANKVLVASSHSPFQNLPFGQKQGTLRVNVHSFKCKTSNMQTNPKFYKNTKNAFPSHLQSTSWMHFDKFQSSKTTFHYINVRMHNAPTFVSLINAWTYQKWVGFTINFNLIIRSIIEEVTTITNKYTIWI